MVGIDGNGQTLLLAWAVVESENKESWTWFLTCLRNAIPECIGMTLISDRDKGLLAADEIVFGDGINRIICCFHLKANLCKRYGGQLSSLFWSIANAESEREYHTEFAILQQQKPTAAQYLSTIPKHLWVTAFYRAPHYGHKTSNIVESMNNVFRANRELSILDLLNEIWYCNRYGLLV